MPGDVDRRPPRRSKRGPTSEASPRRKPLRAAPLAPAKRLAKLQGIEWLREAQKQAQEMYAEARSAESYVAAEKCLRTAGEYQQKVQAWEAAELLGKAPTTEEAFLAEFDERLRHLPLPYLERAVSEYLSRVPGTTLVGVASA